MTEEFLHYIWKYKLLKPGTIKTCTGEEIEIIKTGEHNTNAGPDFFNSRIKIGDTIWAGNTEIHINSSDWNLHKHSTDKAYDNIILHAVYNNNMDLFDKKGNTIPTIELKELIDLSKYNYYKKLKNTAAKIPCEKNLKDVRGFIITAWLERILLERLEKKTNTITSNLNKTKNNWEEIFYIFLSRSMGFNVNAEPMELLAKSIPLSILNKHRNNIIHLEALLFGQSGLLEKEAKDAYTKNLKAEYAFFKKKYSLTPIDAHLWKFLRLRPANFPTIRLSQLATILYKKSNLFSLVTECASLQQLTTIFEADTSEYWKTHYTFGKNTPIKNKSLGKTGINQIVINTIVPMVFIYGKQRGSQNLCDKALNWLEQCPSETNSSITYWKTIGAKCDNAWHSQAYLELKKGYCDKKQCLNCAIGNELLKKH